MLVLQPKEVCPYSLRCPYVKQGQYSINTYPCKGMDPNRDTVFKCDFVKEHGIIEGGYQRNPNDITGKMKIITE